MNAPDPTNPDGATASMTDEEVADWWSDLAPWERANIEAAAIRNKRGTTANRAQRRLAARTNKRSKP